MTKIDKIKEDLLLQKKKKGSSKDWLSTGSTLLNCACTDHPNRGFKKGHYYWLVGDSSSGKTWLSLTCLAEAALNPEFKDYRFIYDNVEGGALMNMSRFFGTEVARRLELPGEGASSTVEEFYYSMDDYLKDALKNGRPFIYILDSMDALTSKGEGVKFEQQKKAFRKGTEVAGSYGDKAKINSSGIRRLLSPLEKSESILIIISQTRDNIGYGSMFEPKRASGGNAPRFYATLEIWSSIKKKIKKEIKGKNRQLGVLVNIKTRKNRITGKERTVTIPIYHSIGIDDLGSLIDFLVEEGRWKKMKGKIEAKEFDLLETRESLVHAIEEKNGEKELREIVGEVWKEIETESQIQRKPRYL